MIVIIMIVIIMIVMIMTVITMIVITMIVIIIAMSYWLYTLVIMQKFVPYNIL